MTTHFQHAVIWLNGASARVLYFEDQAFPVRRFAKTAVLRALETGDGGAVDRLSADLCDALGGASQLLLTGTPEGISAFERHVESTSPEMARRIVGVQRVAAPTNARLSALARWHFTRVLPPATGVADAW